MTRRVTDRAANLSEKHKSASTVLPVIRSITYNGKCRKSSLYYVSVKKHRYINLNVHPWYIFIIIVLIFIYNNYCVKL